MKHTARALVFHCMDFRFVSGIQKFLAERGLKDIFDLVAFAGSAKNLASPDEPSDRAFALRQMDIARRLHGISEVLLFNHLDCGAYGGSSAFASAAEEHDRHVADLGKAREIIRQRFPDLTVHLLIAFLDGKGSVGFEEVTA